MKVFKVLSSNFSWLCYDAKSQLKLELKTLAKILIIKI